MAKKSDDKKSFLLYNDYIEHVDLLDDADAGKVFKAILSYVNGIEGEQLNGMALMAFSFIRSQLDRDNESYERKCQANRINGKKGGRPKKAKPPEEGEPQHPPLEVVPEQEKVEADGSNEEPRKPNGFSDNGSVTPEEPKQEKKKKKEAPVRHQYGEYRNVLLSDEELEKLKKEFPADWAARIERLSSAIAQHGYKYKSHLATIRNWARCDAQNQNRNPQPYGDYGSPEDFYK